MSAPLLMVCASLLFAVMGVCVKLASALYPSGEIVFYRSIIGVAFMATLVTSRGGTLRTTVPAMHFWRSLCGVSALSLWFYSIGGLPLATAVTLNYMSSVWMAFFVLGGSVVLGPGNRGIDGRLVLSVMLGFVGVALILRPTIDQQQLWYGLCGLLSGMLSAMAYLQVTALGRAGEPETRIVFYFSVGGVAAGALTMLWAGGMQPHTPRGLLLLAAIGVLATAAQLMMTRAYATGHTLGNAALQYLGIAFSFGFGVWLFDDQVTWMALAGMALVAGAGLSATLLRSRTPSASGNPTET